MLAGFSQQVAMGGVSPHPSPPAKKLCYNAQTSFLAVVIAPVPFFILTLSSLYTQVKPILILINVQYLQNAVFAP